MKRKVINMKNTLNLYENIQNNKNKKAKGSFTS